MYFRIRACMETDTHIIYMYVRRHVLYIYILHIIVYFFLQLSSYIFFYITGFPRNERLFFVKQVLTSKITNMLTSINQALFFLCNMYYALFYVDIWYAIINVLLV